ncbi:MAG: twin-arginine translocase TatA/TatE family subunit [Chloroflexi bacterium]|nr:twin-arginine translocase TatA/TatE family subunit [Chloroflexota bacterium]
MDIFGVGLGELLAIGIIALLVFGPAQLPEIATTVARTLRQLRKTSQELMDELTQELGTVSEEPRPDPGPQARRKDNP